MATKTIRNEEWKASVLAYDPNGGDKGGSDIRLIRDKIVRAREGGACADCGSDIQPGTLTRVQTGVDDTRIISIRTCQDCCDAMASFEKDMGEAMVARYNITREPPAQGESHE